MNSLEQTAERRQVKITEQQADVRSITCTSVGAEIRVFLKFAGKVSENLTGKLLPKPELIYSQRPAVKILKTLHINELWRGPPSPSAYQLLIRNFRNVPDIIAGI